PSVIVPSMHEPAATLAPANVSRPWHRRLPLYVKILIALILGVAAGELLSKTAAEWFNVPALLILRVLGAIAPPLILVAVVRALLTANVRGRLAGKMFFLLVLN